MTPPLQQPRDHSQRDARARRGRLDVEVVCGLTPSTDDPRRAEGRRERLGEALQRKPFEQQARPNDGGEHRRQHDRVEHDASECVRAERILVGWDQSRNHAEPAAGQRERRAPTDGAEHGGLHQILLAHLVRRHGRAEHVRPSS
eukprot:CAMPEP_0179866420 /NCGR_PEP_ID=MMETSP0982-20121206/17509_1 /TAXON_ID=483367 /ORGANISM="non described non described, Strain CCMP 2436" /LENGTH=143 /DNA_ID=CAMNT_0021755475 /DNA_START=219 /DNA_END=646 /DNA_ORIENTATION=-